MFSQPSKCFNVVFRNVQEVLSLGIACEISKSINAFNVSLFHGIRKYPLKNYHVK